jgi:hypothetical protein
MLAGACSGLYAYFFAPVAPQSGWGRPPNPRPMLQNQKSQSLAVAVAPHGSLHRQLRYSIRAGLAFEIHFVPG